MGLWANGRHFILDTKLLFHKYPLTCWSFSICNFNGYTCACYLHVTNWPQVRSREMSCSTWDALVTDCVSNGGTGNNLSIEDFSKKTCTKSIIGIINSPAATRGVENDIKYRKLELVHTPRYVSTQALYQKKSSFQHICAEKIQSSYACARKVLHYFLTSH